MTQYYQTTLYPLQWGCIVSLDAELLCMVGMEQKTGLQLIKEMVEFWALHKEWLVKNNGDYITTFCQLVAKKVFQLRAEGLSERECVEYFDDAEGWYHLDGRYGIKLEASDELDLDPSEFDVEPAEETRADDVKL